MTIPRHESTGEPTNAAAAALPPTAVVLDIDGVIAPIGGSTLWGDDIVIGDDEDGVRLSPMMCAALDDLPRPCQIGCYWLTDWTRTMRHHLALLPGRSWPEIAEPGDGHSRMGDDDGDRWGTASWWKRRALESWLHRHPEIRHVVWIDDRLYRQPAPPAEAVVEPRATWTGTGRLVGRTSVLLVAPEKRAGLTPDDLSTATDWIDTHTATTSHRSRGATGAPGPTLTHDAHPCEGPGSDPQDLLPDDRAWGSRTPPPSRP